MPAPSTVADFVEIVVKSHVLERDVLDPYLQQMRAAGAYPDRPKKLGATMIRDGLLTPFQVDQFLQGKWRGFWISGKYKLLDHLGIGGMGNVFLCEHRSLRRRVAIKVLPLAHAKDPVALERFYREARAAAALDHPNIVRAHDIDRDGRYHFIVLEYVQGSTLQEIVGRSGPMDATRAAHYVRQAALGLHNAHLADLVHRDVKPANLMLDRQGVVKVLDMGLARFFNDEEGNCLTGKHDQGQILGTADYLAPEQAINGHAVDVRADVYSLGATFYFLLTGRPPFGDGGMAQKLIAHQTRTPTPIRDLRPEAPEGVAEIVRKMMAKDPAARYQSPGEVYEALAPWTQAPIAPPPEEEMPKTGVRIRGDNRGPGSGSAPFLRSAAWPAAPIFPSAEATSVHLAGGAVTPAAVPQRTPRPGRAAVWGFVGAAAGVAVATLVSWAFVHFSTASEPVRPPNVQTPADSAPVQTAAYDR